MFETQRLCFLSLPHYEEYTNALHILVKPKELAVGITAKLRKGDQFGVIAQNDSTRL